MKTCYDCFALHKYNFNTYIMPHTVIKSRYTNVKNHSEISRYFSGHVLPHPLRNSKELAKFFSFQIALAAARAMMVGMPMLTRCHWQCRDRLSQIFATLCKVCFYGWFSIENEMNAGNFCPGLFHWALLSVQFRCFSKKIGYFGK